MLELLVDTGSRDTLALINPAPASSKEIQNTLPSLNYGGRTSPPPDALVNFGKIDVTVAGITVEDQAVGLANETRKLDGILGLFPAEGGM